MSIERRSELEHQPVRIGPRSIRALTHFLDGSRLAKKVSGEKEPLLPGLEKFAWLTVKPLTISCILIILFLNFRAKNSRKGVCSGLYLGPKS